MSSRSRGKQHCGPMPSPSPISPSPIEHRARIAHCNLSCARRSSVPARMQTNWPHSPYTGHPGHTLSDHQTTRTRISGIARSIPYSGGCVHYRLMHVFIVTRYSSSTPNTLPRPRIRHRTTQPSSRLRIPLPSWPGARGQRRSEPEIRVVRHTALIQPQVHARRARVRTQRARGTTPPEHSPSRIRQL